MKPLALSINEVSPYVRLVGEFSVDPGHIETKRVFYDHLLFYVLSGKGRVTVGGESFEAEMGDIFLIRPNVVYTAEADQQEPYARQFIQFDFIYMGEDSDLPKDIKLPEAPRPEKVHPTPTFREGLNLPIRSSMKDNPKIKLLFSSIFEEMYHRKPAFQLAVKAFLIQIILEIHRRALKVNSTEEEQEVLGGLPDAVAEGKRFMERNFMKKISVKEIAERGCVSPVYFERMFKKTVGHTPIRYLTKLRLQYAKELIQNTEKTLSSIANEVGFENVYYFSRVFKKIEGICPTEYRKLANSKEAKLPFLLNEIEMKQGYPSEKIIYTDGRILNG